MKISRQIRKALSYFFFLFDNRDIALKIAFVSKGGIGDALIFLNFIKQFKKWCDSDVVIDYYYNKKKLMELNDGEDYTFIRKIGDAKNIYINMARYDLVIEFHYRFPQVVYYKNRIKRFNKLNKYIRNIKDFNHKFNWLIKNSPKTDGLSCELSKIFDKNRVTQPDITGDIGIKELEPILNTINDLGTLSKFGLEDNHYIVINRSVDKSLNTEDSTKLWPSDYYSELCSLIKKNYSMPIVIVGPKQSGLQIAGVIDLRGKTNFSELKVLLKYAKLLVCSEGGMAHLRHCLSARTSIVLFGPTDQQFYSYSENLNLTSNNCPLKHCEWLSNDWQNICLKDKSNVCCKLRNITPDIVYNTISKYLEN